MNSTQVCNYHLEMRDYSSNVCIAQDNIIKGKLNV